MQITLKFELFDMYVSTEDYYLRNATYTTRAGIIQQSIFDTVMPLEFSIRAGSLELDAVLLSPFPMILFTHCMLEQWKLV